MRTRNSHKRSEAFDIFSAALADINSLNAQVAATLANLDRMDALHNLNLTEKDHVAMDGLTAIGSEVLLTPYVFVTAVGSEEQEQLAAFGRAPESCPVGDSVCQYTVTAGKVSILDHLHEKPELAWAASGIDDVDTYLGAPWFYEGQPLGAFCVLGDAERQWSDDDVRIVEMCANQVTDLFAASTASVGYGGES